MAKNLPNFKDIIARATSTGMEKVPTEAAAPMTEAKTAITRNDVVAKLISTFLGIAASFTITYFGVKWLVNAMDPTRKEKQAAQARAQKMLEQLGVDNATKLSEYELCIASNLVDPQSMEISWSNIGGLEDIIRDIRETVILPFKHTELFRHSPLLQPPKGVLLHGPPGCGKTMIAKATAKAAGARFINLQVSSLVDKWYGESQKRAEAVFSLAIKLQPTIIFIDEIDSFLRSRTSTDHEATAMIKTQFMSFWDGLLTDPDCNVMVMGATNRPQDVDAAILRRMPSMFHIGLPGLLQRQSILQIILSKEKVASLNYAELSELMDGFSGSDLREVCRAAAVTTVHDYFHGRPHEIQQHSGSLREMTMQDLRVAINKVRQTKSISHGVQPVIQLD
ncbi:outer mitochondrial transmembrane helix translocase-like [Babylonia areolata]|uniref:outer mitochondrial transmembrane helix translocase-like n=1 Tax=Babylonia areolata TaxID=304850 RepID=UPI003FD33AAF